MWKTRILLAAVIASSGCSLIVSIPSQVESEPQAEPEQARLVVAIVYDQFPSWVYSKYRDLLSPEGALRRTSAAGADHVVEYAAAGTLTGAGHTAIFTGLPPSESGVGSNQVWSEERGFRSVVDDGEHAVFLMDDVFGSPTMVKADSTGDALRVAHGDQAKIVGLSYKDRGSILTTGRSPDLALWYDKRLGKITTSTYYADSFPDWVATWNAENPIEDRFIDWEPLDAEMLEELLGPDDAPGEGDYQGFGTTFPHNSKDTRDPNRTFRLMPQSNDHLLDLARVTVDRFNLGEDEIPDLLVLSISNIDYTGHAFGPDSWEYVDQLIRTDAAIGRFLAELEEQTSLAVLITSDHGVASLPERSKEDLPNAGRIYPDSLPGQLNAAMAEMLGTGEWVGAYSHPFGYLTEAARAEEVRDEVIRAALEASNEMPEVYAAYDVRDAVDWREHADPIKRAVGLAVPSADLGDFFIVLDEGSVPDEGMPVGSGTSHGSPWSYDRQVPAVFSGPGVTRIAGTDPLEQNRVAATLCRLLGIEPMRHLRDIEPLPGF